MTVSRRLSFPLASLFSLTRVVSAIPMPKKDKDDKDEKDDEDEDEDDDKKPKKPKKNGPPVKVVAGQASQSANGKPVFTIEDGGKDKEKSKDKRKETEKEKDRKPPTSDSSRSRPLPIIVPPPPGSDSVTDRGKQPPGPADSLPPEPGSPPVVTEPVMETLTTPKAFYSYEEGLVQEGSQIYEGVWVPSTRSGPTGEYGCVLWTQDGQEPTEFWRPQCSEPALVWWAWVIIVVGALLVAASCIKCTKAVAWVRARVGVGLVRATETPSGKVAPVPVAAQEKR